MNLFAVNYKNHAKTCHDYALAPNAANRLKIAEEHLDLAPTVFGVIMQTFGRNPHLREQAQEGFTLEQLKTAFPKVSRVAQATQKLDDQTDLVMDMLAEHKTGRICPNYILARADALGGLTNEKGQFNPAIIEHTSAILKTKPVIQIHELPAVLQTALQETGREFKQDARQQNKPVRIMLEHGWNHSIKRGLLPAKNDRSEEAYHAITR